MSKFLNFKISSALKNIIGKELINDKYIAVFELVKNSYDAGASRVDIRFYTIGKNARIEIIDNGCGMTYDDLVNKWLFVAYSEKKERNQNDDYRKKIKRVAAGAKGVGRFSCDRLGRRLTLLTNTKDDSMTNKLELDWDRFENDDKKEFINIAVDYEEENKEFDSGTKIIISDLREQWEKSDVLQLKKALKRLINPDIEQNDDIFEVYLWMDLPQGSLIEDEVNGKIVNDVFERLNIKTTSISVSISKTGEYINTELYDRGTYIYSIKEKNPYTQLKGISAKIFYLNRNAKTEFTKSMGVEPVKYGSVFVYKNRFRIYPYGEPNNDFLDIDKRKAQGYNRFLGTRDILGRISIVCDDSHFIETSSRNSGFLMSPEFVQLTDFFHKNVFKILEDYVVRVIEWGDVSKEDAKIGKEKVLNPEDVKLDILNQITALSKKKDILEVDYNQNLLDVIEKASSDNLDNTLKNLNKIATLTNNEQLKEIANKVIKQTQSAFKKNEEDRKKLASINKKNSKLENELESEKRKSYFMYDSLSLEQKKFIEKMHTININIDTLKMRVFSLRDDVLSKQIDQENICNELENLYFILEKMRSLTQYSGAADFNVNDRLISGSLSDFIQEYCQKLLKRKNLNFIIDNKGYKFVCKFSPQDISTLIENLVSNSEKAKSTEIRCNFYIENNQLHFDYEDNGIGLKKNIDVNSIFEFGKSYSNGTGVGMYHIKRIVEEMGGEVSVDQEFINGFRIQMRFTNERNKSTLVWRWRRLAKIDRATHK